ncbi:MAG: tRNA pseudouridine(13) synthase TruD [Phycisphaeraceae bacterium]|nr:tRNA pseudouridine(13) synthase TruD [Phycisphaeraceae bacterium]
MPCTLTSSLSYLTASLPGVGGRIRCRLEDFIVEELPLYPASGRGEHLMMLVEKRHASTMETVWRLAKAFHVGRGAVGYAGLKDKLAVSRQHFTVHLPGREAEDAEGLSRLADSPFRVIWSARHDNKLRRGHLAANRFDLRIREVQPDAADLAGEIVRELERVGVPNYYGQQRFGYRQQNARLGRMLLLGQWRELLDLMLGGPLPVDQPAIQAAREAYGRGDHAAALNGWPRSMRHERQALDALRQGRSPEHAVMRMDGQQREFLVSAWQSDLFNRILDRRLREGCLDHLLDGDVAFKHDSRATFTVDAMTAELENGPEGRMAQHLISPTGPMWGYDVTIAGGVPGTWEHEALASEGMTPASLVGGPQGKALGTRRPSRVFLEQPRWSMDTDQHGACLRLAFSLDRGSFATVVLREIMKNEQHEAVESEGES